MYCPVIGSRQVKNLVKLQVLNSVSQIEYKKVYHEKIGIYIERRLAIVLKIRSKLTPFFSRYTGGTEIKEILMERSVLGISI